MDQKEIEQRLKSGVEIVKKVGIHLTDDNAARLWVQIMTINSMAFLKTVKTYVTFKTASTKDPKQVTVKMLFDMFRLLQKYVEARQKAGKTVFANPREQTYCEEFSWYLTTSDVLKTITPPEIDIFENGTVDGVQESAPVLAASGETQERQTEQPSTPETHSSSSSSCELSPVPASP